LIERDKNENIKKIVGLLNSVINKNVCIKYFIIIGNNFIL